MPHLPVIVWVVFAITPVVIGFLLHVEETVVQPSIEAERRAKAPEPKRPERSSAAARKPETLAG